MSGSGRDDELESLRTDGLSSARRDEFRAAARAAAAWSGRHPTDLAGALDWIDRLREVFGDPPVDPRVRCGGDYRL